MWTLWKPSGLSFVDEKTYKEPAPKQLVELRQWLCFSCTLGARTFYTSPLRKCKKTQRKTFWLAIFRLFNVKWIMNNILSFTKCIFNNQWNLSEKKSERTFETPCISTKIVANIVAGWIIAWDWVSISCSPFLETPLISFIGCFNPKRLLMATWISVKGDIN